MRLDRTDGYFMSDDKALLNVERVFAWLSTDAYWALGRPRRMVEDSIAASDSYGVYAADGEQVAFSRVVTDRATFGWVCDVYVDPAHRGRGLGTWMVGNLRDEYAAFKMRRLLLATHDAHGVYASIGFTPLPKPDQWMELAYAGVPPIGSLPDAGVDSRTGLGTGTGLESGPGSDEGSASSEPGVSPAGSASSGSSSSGSSSSGSSSSGQHSSGRDRPAA
ncbi:MAG TPA: GNAT family N-acetyltransferase [Actinocrinis sp.]|nr:GNAT family N-acetyltransferase [Actinocrinis sp.]